MITLMPASLVEAISSRHGVCIEHARSRYDLGVQLMRIHNDTYGYIPTTWSQYMRDAVTTLGLTSSTTRDEFMSKLIDLQVKRLAWITKLVAEGLEESDLLEMSMKELAEQVEEHCEYTVRKEATATGGTRTTVSRLNAPERKAA